MLEHILKIANLSINPMLFLIGISWVYLTGIILLIAVGIKFWEHSKNHQELDKESSYYFSTGEMTVFVLLLFAFWLNSIGQFKITNLTTQYIFFAIGSIMVLFSTIWHIWAKVNIGFMWSDDIEIKKKHTIITYGAFAIARHPMYASLLMWCWGASFLMFNWITLLAVSFIFLPLMIQRAREEEKNLATKNKDYYIFQQNVRMLTPTVSGVYSVIVRIILISLLGYFTYTGTIDVNSLCLLVFIYLYGGFSFIPEKVAFSFRSKSVIIGIVGLLSIYVWYPICYFYYVVVAMSLFGLKWNCPCMWIYEKYQGCPLLLWIKKYK